MPYRPGSGFRAVLQRCARPVLAVPAARPALKRALLAFDGSARAREALFVATYLAEEHGTQLTVLTVAAGPEGGAETLDLARRYLDLHGVTADYETRAGSVGEQIIAGAEALDPDLLLMGGYGLHPVLEVVVGSAVDHVLREGRWPVLVCR
jgi:nucleotide-binding universal stress UspA family protein